MAVVTICSDFGAQKIKSDTVSTVSPSVSYASWQIDGETMETVTDFIFLGSKITEDGGCSHEIKRYLLLAVQGTLKSLLQHHSSKVSILQRSAFFIVQLLHPYVTPGKTIALTRWTFVGKVKSLLFIYFFIFYFFRFFF